MTENTRRRPLGEGFTQTSASSDTDSDSLSLSLDAIRSMSRYLSSMIMRGTKELPQRGSIQYAELVTNMSQFGIIVTSTTNWDQLVTALVRRGADINYSETNNAGNEVLAPSFTALNNRDYSLLKDFIDGGANIFVPNSSPYYIKKTNSMVSEPRPILSIVMDQIRTQERDAFIEEMFNRGEVAFYTSGDDVINMDYHGVYRGGAGHDRFIVYPIYVGKSNDKKVVIEDLNSGEDMDYVDLCKCSLSASYNSQISEYSNEIGRGMKVPCGNTVVYLQGAHFRDEISFVFGDGCNYFQ